MTLTELIAHLPAIAKRLDVLDAKTLRRQVTTFYETNAPAASPRPP